MDNVLRKFLEWSGVLQASYGVSADVFNWVGSTQPLQATRPRATAQKPAPRASRKIMGTNVRTGKLGSRHACSILRLQLERLTPRFPCSTRLLHLALQPERLTPRHPCRTRLLYLEPSAKTTHSSTSKLQCTQLRLRSASGMVKMQSTSRNT